MRRGRFLTLLALLCATLTMRIPPGALRAAGSSPRLLDPSMLHVFTPISRASAE